MSIAENLIPNESVVLEVRKHWMAPVRASAVAVGLVLLAGLLAVIRPGGEGLFGFIASILAFLQSALVIVGAAWIVYNILVWRVAAFAVTTLRVLRSEGLVQRRTSETLLAAISDVKLDVGFLGRSLGYGDIRIMTVSGRAGSDHFRAIVDATGFRNAIMTQKLVEQSASRAAYAAPAAVAPIAPPAAAAKPASPVASGPSASDAAQTIKELGELRDEGLLTAEEFDAKKAEILARI
jgi:uncharacterized membrane protein YdbT with pleckstrin-like domain